ncbi:hypothetical protein FRC07_004082 [Ceratobasidium sp. 392]|nr:hypothetical protein FRC07_004082 [Ceratobasidium sp. 392]
MSSLPEPQLTALLTTSSQGVCIVSAGTQTLTGVGHTSVEPPQPPEGFTTHNPPAAPYPSTRSRARLHELYREECDVLPEPPAPLLPAPSIPPAASAFIPRARTRMVPFETPPDSFGRYRIYPSRPLTIPDSHCLPADFVSENHSPELPNKRLTHSSLSNALSPCPNLSTFYFLYWFWKGRAKSRASRKKLQDIICHPRFNPRDLDGVDLPAIDDKLAKAAYDSPSDESGFEKSEGWRGRNVSIQVPSLTKLKAALSTPTQYVSVSGMHSRKILDGIRRLFSTSPVTHTHFEPYWSRWIPPGAPKSEAQTLCDEIYTSPAMIEAHKEVQNLKISDESCKLPRAVAAIMLGSDGLQLGPFSHAKAWVLYMWLGNLSKYERCKPNSNSCFELAHIPSRLTITQLPDSIKDIITELNGRPPLAGLLTHLRRELMHAVLRELLDDEFLHAWQHGIKIRCADGIERRVFPRLFTYTADYPERQVF